MLEEAHALPDDIAALKAMVLASRAELAARDAELRNRDLLIGKLRHQLAGLRRQRFGATSEALDQLELGLEDEEIARAAEAPPEPTAASKTQPKRRPLPDHLPREEMVLTPGDRCSACGNRLKRLGEDVAEELEYVPGRFVVKRIVRPRLACGGCETFHQAPLPPRPIERGRPGPGLLAHVLVSKYCDHLPLYRQSRIFARDGVELDRSTLAGWVGKATALLEPLADAIGRHVLAGRALFADDTPVKMLAPGTGKTATGRAWTYVRDERPWNGEAPPAAWYRFSADRKAAHPKGHLEGFAGWMHSDGYAGFGALARAGPVREVACLAHVRRRPAPDLIRGSSTSMPPRARRSPPGRWNGSPPSTPSRRKPAASRPSAVLPSDKPGPNHVSTSSSAGCKRSCRRSPPRPRWRRRSAMRSPGSSASGPISNTASWRSTTTRPSAR